ncbi:MAG: microcin ABC transporter permease, partial [Rhodospirillales bacterium]
MFAYILRRLLLIPPTLLGIMIINFAVVQILPGGPIEQLIAQISGEDVSSTARVSGDGGSEVMSAKPPARGSGGDSTVTSKYRGAQGLPPEFIKDLERQFGLDKPAHERFWLMMKRYVTFDFGNSYFRDQSVTQLVLDKMPVSISLGLWTTLLVYLISIPLGVAKAVRDGSKFDVWTSGLVIFGNAVPGFLFAILLIVLFAGGRYFDWFPLRGLVSDDWDQMSLLGQIGDYLWHMALPVLA